MKLCVYSLWLCFVHVFTPHTKRLKRLQRCSGNNSGQNSERNNNSQWETIRFRIQHREYTMRCLFTDGSNVTEEEKRALCFFFPSVSVPKNSPKFAFQKRNLGNVYLVAGTQCNITPNSLDAFMRRGTFVVSSSVCRVLRLHALMFCVHACYWLTCIQLQLDRFSYKRMRAGHVGVQHVHHHGGTWTLLYVFVFMFVLH